MKQETSKGQAKQLTQAKTINTSKTIAKESKVKGKVETMKASVKTIAVLFVALGAINWSYGQVLPGQNLDKDTPALDVTQEKLYTGSPKGKRTLQVIEDRNQTYMATKVYPLKYITGADITPFVLGAVQRYDHKSTVERLNYKKAPAGVPTQYIVVTTAEQMIPYVDDMVAKLDRPGKKDASGTIVDGDGIYRFVYYPKYRFTTDLLSIGKMIGSGDGTYYADSSVNMLYWKDSKSDGGGVLKWYQALDRPIPQVELRMNVYELNDNDVKELGVDYVSWKNGPGAELMGFGADLSRFRINQEMLSRATNLFSNITSSWGGLMFAPQFDASFLRMLDQKGKAWCFTSGSITVANDFNGSYSINFSPGYQNISKTSLMEMSVTNDNKLDINLTVNKPVICFDDSANVGGTIMFNYIVDLQSVIERNNVGNEFINHNVVSSNLTLDCGTEKMLAVFSREHDVSQYDGMPFLGDIPIIKYFVGAMTHSIAESKVCVTVTATGIAPDASLSKWAGQLVDAVEMLRVEKKENNWGFNEK